MVIERIGRFLDREIVNVRGILRGLGLSSIERCRVIRFGFLRCNSGFSSEGFSNTFLMFVSVGNELAGGGSKK